MCSVGNNLWSQPCPVITILLLQHEVQQFLWSDDPVRELEWRSSLILRHISEVNTLYTRSCPLEMSWTLEASFALAALILTLMLSGLGLVLKYRKGTSPLGKDTLLQMFVEDSESGVRYYKLQWVDIADVRRYQQATYTSMVRFRQRRPLPPSSRASNRWRDLYGTLFTVHQEDLLLKRKEARCQNKTAFFFVYMFWPGTRIRFTTPKVEVPLQALHWGNVFSRNNALIAVGTSAVWQSSWTRGVLDSLIDFYPAYRCHVNSEVLASSASFVYT